MKNIDLLIYPHWIITLNAKNAIHENHAIAVHDSKILDILSVEQAKTRYQAQETIYLDRHALMPGFINTHAHSAMIFLRSMADDLPLMDWLHQYIFPAEKRWLSPEFIYDGMMFAQAEMIRSGTTCFYDHYYFPDTIAESVNEGGMRACIGAGVLIDFENAWSKGIDDAIAKAKIFHRDYQQFSDRTSISLAPHAPYTLSNDSLRKLKKLSDETQLTVQMHVHETRAEIEHSLKEYGMRPLKRLYQHDLLSDRFMAVHMTQIDQEDCEIIQKTGIHVIHCPESNLKLASGFCPIAALSEAGTNIALGTDSAATNNDLDMLAEMHMAALLAKGVSGDATAIPANRAMQIATKNGAKALGLEEQIGSLEIGKYADFISIDLSDLATQPVYHPIASIVYASNRSQIKNVWVAGKQLLKDGKLTTLNEEKIRQNAVEWGKRIKVET